MVPTYFCSDATEDPEASKQQWFYTPYAISDDEQLENMCTDEELHEDTIEKQQVIRSINCFHFFNFFLSPHSTLS